MNGTPERTPIAAQRAQKVAEMFAEGLRNGKIDIVDGVYWKDGADKPVIITISASSDDRVKGSGSKAESDYQDLLALRAAIAGMLHQYSPEVDILYQARFVSIPDNGADRIAQLVDGYEITQIPVKS